MRALLVYPTHENGREVAEQYLAGGIDAACYPGRMKESSGRCSSPRGPPGRRSWGRLGGSS